MAMVREADGDLDGFEDEAAAATDEKASEATPGA